MVSWLRGFVLIAVVSAGCIFGQSINSGTVTGQVTDPSGLFIAGAKVRLANPVTGYEQSAVTDNNGNFRFNNVPVNNYRLEVSSQGFNTAQQNLDVHNSVPVTANIALSIATAASTVTVQATAAAVETDTAAHQDVDSSAFEKLPVMSPGAGLSDAITYSTGAVAADANGFFHPLGDHAQTTFVIDGQPISDQQSKVFSTQIPPNAIPEYGTDHRLAGCAIRRQDQPGGERDHALRPGRYPTVRQRRVQLGLLRHLDRQRHAGLRQRPTSAISWRSTGSAPAAFWIRRNSCPSTTSAITTPSSTASIISPARKDVFHLNLFAARNWFQVPNSYDQLSQDQKQRVLTWNIAPGYQHTFNAHTLLTINPFVRRDQLNYYPSRDPFDDTPATASQNRFLMNYGVKADLSSTHGHHNIKFGTQIQQTRLLENFAFGITDPTFNPVCLDARGIRCCCRA